MHPRLDLACFACVCAEARSLYVFYNNCNCLATRAVTPGLSESWIRPCIVGADAGGLSRYCHITNALEQLNYYLKACICNRTYNYVNTLELKPTIQILDVYP